jgi:acyl-CoA synthetase (AMP-forming)/AMP-acid ligase II
MAVFFHEKNVRVGMCVGVFMSNSPEMVIAILALSKLGAVAGLINSALRGNWVLPPLCNSPAYDISDETLAHCLGVASAQLILSTPDLSEFVTTPFPHFTISFGGFPSITTPPNLNAVFITPKDLPSSSAPFSPAKRTRYDVAVLIFTSGTTGKPKACAIRNNQFLVVSNPLPQDTLNPKRYFPLRQYSALPLFHGTGLFTGFSYCVGTSGTFCLSRKFSSSRFWKEVSESGATRIIYVGELCRYLIAAPPSEWDRKHNCIVANGNGLRAEVWTKFKERFNVPEIREFYRSTEGIGKFDNFGFGDCGKGKIGFAGPLKRYFEDDSFLIRIDPETEQPFRDPKTGFCVRAKIGEPGEVIGRVRDRGTVTEYQGNVKATDEKLLNNVFRKGDMFHRMGDLAVHERDGWVAFHDRIGDTFRWKGENVSAGEVRDHVSKLGGVRDVAVYGVKLSR